MPRCSGSKPDGSPCERIVGASQRYCSGHDPARKEARRKAASKAARSKGRASNGELVALKEQLAGLCDELRDGRVKPGVGGVLVQALNARIRLAEFGHRVEYDRRTTMSASDAEAFMAALEAVLRKHVRDSRMLDAIGVELEAVAEKGL